MNRPFHAIGLLLAFLALAILAVGSASRPRAKTTHGQAVSLTGQQMEAPLTTTARGGIYVLVLPAGEDLAAEFLVPSDLPMFALGCGLDRTTGVTYPQPETGAEADVQPHPDLWTGVVFVPVTISAAQEPNLPVSPIESDCMAHHDALYDELIHGFSRANSESSPTFPPLEASDPLDEADALKLILELIGGDVAAAG